MMTKLVSIGALGGLALGIVTTGHSWAGTGGLTDRKSMGLRGPVKAVTVFAPNPDPDRASSVMEFDRNGKLIALCYRDFSVEHECNYNFFDEGGRLRRVERYGAKRFEVEYTANGYVLKSTGAGTLQGHVDYVYPSRKGAEEPTEEVEFLKGIDEHPTWKRIHRREGNRLIISTYDWDTVAGGWDPDPSEVVTREFGQNGRVEREVYENGRMGRTVAKYDQDGEELQSTCSNPRIPAMRFGYSLAAVDRDGQPVKDAQGRPIEDSHGNWLTQYYCASPIEDRSPPAECKSAKRFERRVIEYFK